jgi:hypothetical protein
MASIQYMSEHFYVTNTALTGVIFSINSALNWNRFQFTILPGDDSPPMVANA